MSSLLSGVPQVVYFADTLPYFAPQSSRVDRAEIDTHGRTDPGCGRDRSDDQFVVARLSRHTELEHTSLPADTSLRMWAGTEGRVLAVADGMGESDSVASTIVLQAMLEHIIHNVPWPGEDRASIDEIVLNELARGLDTCQARLDMIARDRGLGRAPGAVLTLAYLVWPTLYALHAGSGRCYLHRGSRLARLTGRPAGGPARVAGAAADVAFGVERIFTMVAGRGRVEVELARVSLCSGDVLLLCSSGLGGVVSEETIARELVRGTSARQSSQYLVEAAKRASGRDPVTVVVARV